MLSTPTTYSSLCWVEIATDDEEGIGRFIDDLQGLALPVAVAVFEEFKERAIVVGKYIIALERGDLFAVIEVSTNDADAHFVVVVVDGRCKIFGIGTLYQDAVAFHEGPAVVAALVDDVGFVLDLIAYFAADEYFGLGIEGKAPEPAGRRPRSRALHSLRRQRGCRWGCRRAFYQHRCAALYPAGTRGPALAFGHGCVVIAH